VHANFLASGPDTYCHMGLFLVANYKLFELLGAMEVTPTLILSSPAMEVGGFVLQLSKVGGGLDGPPLQQEAPMQAYLLYLYSSH
jgi:hypothetical protein